MNKIVTDEVLRKYYKSYSVILKLLKYRGFDSKTVDKHIITEEAFYETYLTGECTIEQLKNSLSEDMVFEKGGENKTTTIVLWIVEAKLGANISEVNTSIVNANATSAIVIADNGVTAQAKETIRILRTTRKIIVDVWTLEESMVYTPEQKHVPEHRICSPKEKKEIYTVYGLKGDQLPKMVLGDTMVKFLGATQGQLIEIIRTSETDPSSKYKTYRIVVK